MADQEQGSSLEASPLKMAGEGERWGVDIKLKHEVFVHFYIFLVSLFVSFGETALKHGAFKTFLIASAPPLDSGGSDRSTCW